MVHNLTARRTGHITQADGSTVSVLSLGTYRTKFAIAFCRIAGVKPDRATMRAALRMRARGVLWTDAANALAGEYLAAHLPPELA